MAGGFYCLLDTPLLQSNACEKLLFSDHANFSDFMFLFCRERLKNEQSAEDGCEMYKVWNSRVELLFRLLDLVFCHVLVAVFVVVCLKSLIDYLARRQSTCSFLITVQVSSENI